MYQYFLRLAKLSDKNSSVRSFMLKTKKKKEIIHRYSVMYAAAMLVKN